MGEEYISVSPPLGSFFHSPGTSTLLVPNNLSTLFSNTLFLRSFLNVSDQVSHPYKTTDKIIVLYILIFVFLDQTEKQKILLRMIASILWLQTALNVFLNRLLIWWGCSQYIYIYRKQHQQIKRLFSNKWIYICFVHEHILFKTPRQTLAPIQSLTKCVNVPHSLGQKPTGAWPWPPTPLVLRFTTCIIALAACTGTIIA